MAGVADLTLCTMDGDEPWTGTAVDDTNPTACHADSFAGCAIADANRPRLAAALRGAGLVNYSSEWRHWPYGDRYWAYLTGSYHTCYGPVDLHRPI